MIASEESIIKDAQLGVTLRNANDALCIFEGMRKSFPRSSFIPYAHTAVTCCSATAAATTYRTRRRVESHKRENIVYERGRVAVGGSQATIVEMGTSAM